MVYNALTIKFETRQGRYITPPSANDGWCGVFEIEITGVRVVLHEASGGAYEEEWGTPETRGPIVAPGEKIWVVVERYRDYDTLGGAHGIPADRAWFRTEAEAERAAAVMEPDPWFEHERFEIYGVVAETDSPITP